MKYFQKTDINYPLNKLQTSQFTDSEEESSVSPKTRSEGRYRAQGKGRGSGAVADGSGQQKGIGKSRGRSQKDAEPAVRPSGRMVATSGRGGRKGIAMVSYMYMHVVDTTLSSKLGELVHWV